MLLEEVSMEYFCENGHERGEYLGSVCRECLSERNQEIVRERQRFVRKILVGRAFNERRLSYIVQDAEKSSGIRNRLARQRVTRIGRRVKTDDDRFSHRDILNLLEAQEGCCKGCLTPFSEVAYEVDHKIPLELGGSNSPANLQLLCCSCNTSKGAKDNDVWLSSLRTRQVLEYLEELEEELSYGN